MELAVIIIAILVIAFLIFRNTTPKALEFLDVNKDGKVDSNDVKAAADVNKDGKVDSKDVKVAVEKTKAAVKNKPQRKNKTNGSRPQRKA